MSRKIKFRAWNEYAKTMYDVDMLHIRNPAGQLGFDLTATNYMSLVYQPKTVLMQFTGLKDKNDVEIYEGDIVAYELMTVDVRGAVSYNSTTGQFVKSAPIEEGGEKPLVSYIKSTEVIGNIYENLGLMK